MKNSTENNDSTTQNEMKDKVESPSTRERKTREAWITAEEMTENLNQSMLAIHTSLDLGVDYVEGNTTLEVMITSGDTTAEDVELKEEEAWKEEAGQDQAQRQKSPEPVGSSTPKHSAETEGEYMEDGENLIETKTELFEADTLEVAEATVSSADLGGTKFEFPEDREGDKKKTVVELLNTLQQNHGDVTFQGETLEKMRRRQKHMDNITKLMGKLEVENNLSEREWRKPGAQQRYVNNQNIPFKKVNDTA